MVRPPDEAICLPLRLTTGCSYNGCNFCDLYRHSSYSVVSLEEVRSVLDRFTSARGLERVFLGEGDAFSLDTDHLLEVLSLVHSHMPWVTSVGIYAISTLALRKSTQELKSLREAGLTRVYYGLEAGSESILRRLRKPGTAEDCALLAGRLRQAGLWQETTVLLGLSDPEATGKALGKIAPDQVRAIPLKGTSVEQIEREKAVLLRESGLPRARFRLP